VRQLLVIFSCPSMADNDGLVDGIHEDELIDDAEVDSMIREAIAQVVSDNPFIHAKINAWSSNIVEGCLKRLAALQKPFKYVVTCNLSQKAGAGLHAASCQRWNDKTDGKLTVHVENETMLILVTVYWLAI
jgi:dynein light chain Tctex-type 1